MHDERAERRRFRALVAVASLAVVVLIAALVPSPYAVEQPGPVVNALGSVRLDDGDEAPVIFVHDAEMHDSEGALNLLTVAISGTPDEPRSWLSLVPALFDPSQRIAPITDFYPDGVTVEQRETQNSAYMDSSQELAAAAAFRWLGEPVRATLSVAGVLEHGPAEGVLEPGDVILSAAGQDLDDFSELRKIVSDTGAGAELRLEIERGGDTVEAVLIPEVPVGGGDPMIGATISSAYDLPKQVDVSLSQIGGPSAGLVFALGTIELLTPGSLLGDLTVSATGTISGAGEVGAIGGLESKMWAADRAGSDLLLMPTANCADLPDRLPSGLEIVPVGSIDEAVDAVEVAVAGEPVPGLERCDASPGA